MNPQQMDMPHGNTNVRGATGLTERRNAQYIQAGVQTDPEADQPITSSENQTTQTHIDNRHQKTQTEINEIRDTGIQTDITAEGLNQDIQTFQKLQQEIS